MKTVFKNCTLLDGTRDMCVKKGVDISVENGKIVRIGEIKPDSGDEIIDLTGKYLMPGLINLHVHLPAGGKPQKKPLKADMLSKLALSSAFMREFTLRMCHS